MSNMFYYIVTAKLGHVGRGKYTVKDIPIKAHSKKEAAYEGRFTPRVKHDWKYAIESVTKVSKEDYEIALDKYNNDPFFKCKNIQEQREYCGEIEIFQIQVPKYLQVNHEERRAKIEYKIKKREEKFKIRDIDY